MLCVRGYFVLCATNDTPPTPSGTNLEQAKHVLQASTMKIIPANDLEEAASKSCNMAQIVALAKQQHLDVNFSIPI